MTRPLEQIHHAVAVLADIYVQAGSEERMRQAIDDVENAARSLDRVAKLVERSRNWQLDTCDDPYVREALEIIRGEK